jgi:hypothetical protein
MILSWYLKKRTPAHFCKMAELVMHLYDYIPSTIMIELLSGVPTNAQMGPTILSWALCLLLFQGQPEAFFKTKICKRCILHNTNVAERSVSLYFSQFKQMTFWILRPNL